MVYFMFDMGFCGDACIDGNARHLEANVLVLVVFGIGLCLFYMSFWFGVANGVK